MRAAESIVWLEDSKPLCSQSYSMLNSIKPNKGTLKGTARHMESGTPNPKILEVEFEMLRPKRCSHQGVEENRPGSGCRTASGLEGGCGFPCGYWEVSLVRVHVRVHKVVYIVYVQDVYQVAARVAVRVATGGLPRVRRG